MATISLIFYDPAHCDRFAARLAELVAREPEEFGADVVVPVPLHPDRQRERGYNQAELIARPLARRLHLKQGAYCWSVPSLARRAWCPPAKSTGLGTWRLRYSQGSPG